MPEIVRADPMPDMFTQLSGGRFDVRPLDLESSGLCSDTVGIVTYSHPLIDGRVMDRFPNLRVISNHGVGVDHIDLNAARERGIPVGNTPGCLDGSTADMTMALLLAVARNVVIGDRYARCPEFIHYDPSILIGQEVCGSTLGIIGMGRIGAEVARRAHAFQMQIVYHNRNPRPEIESALGATWCPLNELLQTSDFVTLNCPLTPTTQGLMGREQFDLMKSSAILINMARGPVVQTEALYEALQNRRIAAAGLDVTDPEPLPRNHPLLTLSNIIITPHLGSVSNRTRQRMMELTIENLAAGLARQELLHRVR